jgi:hypothetical protein
MMIDLIRPYPGEDEVSFIKRKAYFIRVIQPRLEYSNKRLDDKKNHLTPISAAEREEISEFWGEFLSTDMRGKFVDDRYYDFFKHIKNDGEQVSQYVNNYFYAFIDEYYTNPQRTDPCDDKNLYDLYFQDVKRPQTVFRKLRNIYLDENYQEISQQEAVKRARDCEEVVLKIGRFAYGGKSLLFWKSSEAEEQELVDFLQHNDNIVCQRVIKQHAELSRLNPTSVNTVRIMTLHFDGQIHVPSSILRMGVNESRVDNGSQGGIVCGIQENGQLKSFARDLSGNTYLQHPGGTRFESVVIPNFNECIDMVTMLAKRFVAITRSISWDLAIGEDGHPILLESNLSGGGLDVHQVCNGPLYGDMTHDVIAEVFKNSYTLKSIIKSL